jgi:hypothetical protein
MSEIPWWIVLIVAWGAAGTGFLLAAILSLGKLADEATEKMQVMDVKSGYNLNSRWNRLAQKSTEAKWG